MECFRYGLSIPYIQIRAINVSNNVPTRRIRYRRYRKPVTRRYRKPVPAPAPIVPKVKIYKPYIFSIELHNMFEILDI